MAEEMLRADALAMIMAPAYLAGAGVDWEQLAPGDQEDSTAQMVDALEALERAGYTVVRKQEDMPGMWFVPRD